MDKKLLIIAGYDSYLKSSLIIDEVFTENNYTVDYYIALEDPDIKHINDIGLKKKFRAGSLKKLFLDIDLGSYDAVYPHLDGTSIFRFFNKYYEIFAGEKIKRPIVFTGYTGIVYEFYLKGFLERQPADIFYVNSKNDYNLFSSFCRKLDLPQDNLLITGLPFLDTAYRYKKFPVFPPKVLLFAGQPTVPKSYSERLYIVEQLIHYAQRNKDVTVYLKPRHRPEQTSFHIIDYHYETIIRSLGRKRDIPENFILTYEPIQDLLTKADLCLTVSSTAAYEAIAMGVKTCFISDFGLKEQYGNHYFLNSGAFMNFSELISSEVPALDRAWKDEFIKCDGRNSIDLFEAVDSLVEKQCLGKKPVFLRPFYLGRLMKGYLDFKDDTQIFTNTMSGKIERALIGLVGYLLKRRFIRKKVISIYSKIQFTSNLLLLLFF